MQPISCVAKWDGDKLTVWGMGKNIYPSRAHAQPGGWASPSENVRFINKWNGGTFGGADAPARSSIRGSRTSPKRPNRPVKMMLPKDQEMAHLQVKPQTLTKFKVGATKDGKIVGVPARVPRQYGRECWMRELGRRRAEADVRAVHARRSQLEEDRLPLQDQFDASPARRAAIPSRSSSGPGNR